MRHAWMMSMMLASLGCIELRATGDSPQADAQLPDLAMDAAVGTDMQPDAAHVDALSVQEPVDHGVPDAMRDAGLPDCSLPIPPPVECGPEQLGPFETVPLNDLIPALGPDGIDPNRLFIPDRCQRIDAGPVEVTTEAEFQAQLTCPEDVERRPSMIDWTTHRLLLLQGLSDTLLAWAVIVDERLRLGFDVPADCGGAPQLGAQFAFLIPNTLPPLGELVPCAEDLGPFGCCACEVICDPEPRVGECTCPP